MWLEDPHDVMFDFIPGSPEIRDLFMYGIEHRGAQIWNCYGCGEWLPTA